jgi:hypothetical protein
VSEVLEMVEEEKAKVALGWAHSIADMDAMGFLDSLGPMLEDEVFSRHPGSTRGVVTALLASEGNLVGVSVERLMGAFLTLEQSFLLTGMSPPLWMGQLLDEASMLLTSGMEMPEGNYGILVDDSVLMGACSSMPEFTGNSEMRLIDIAACHAGVLYHAVSEAGYGCDVFTFNATPSKWMFAGNGGPLAVANTIRRGAKLTGEANLRTAVLGMLNEYDVVNVITGPEAPLLVEERDLIVAEGWLPADDCVVVEVL